MLKPSFLALCAALYLATAGWAQTAAERYEKGLYNQQTAGNLDAAIEAYRQAIATAGADRALAGRAQTQLVGRGGRDTSIRSAILGIASSLRSEGWGLRVARDSELSRK
jgi:hypothetical protein